jgi:hypothetical protein
VFAVPEWTASIATCLRSRPGSPAVETTDAVCTAPFEHAGCTVLYVIYYVLAEEGEGEDIDDETEAGDGRKKRKKVSVPTQPLP